MADVTVNIRGNASQLRDELNSVASQPTSTAGTAPNVSSGGSPSRMIDDFRREMQQRGVMFIPGSSNMTQMISQYRQTASNELNERITEKYDLRRSDMRKRMSAEYDEIDKDIEDKRQQGLKNAADDPIRIFQLNEQLEKDREKQYKRVGTKYDEEEERINREETDERNKSEDELTKAIQELTEQINAEQGNSSSYIGKLREQQRELIAKRDNAETEEDAISASRELAELNEKMRRVLSGNAEQPQGKGLGLTALQKGAGALGIVNSLQQGDLGGAVVGGAIMSGNPYAIAAALAFKGIQTIADNISKQYSSFATVGAFRGTVGGATGGDAVSTAAGIIGHSEFTSNSASNLGMKSDEFSQEAVKRIRQRGTSYDWYDEVYRQLALEQSLALRPGALGEGGKFDRYGVDATYGLSELVTMLSNIDKSGVSYGDFTRVQEKYDIQQQIMNSYMGRTDRPKYEVANRNLAAFSSIKGITQDSRIGTEYEKFQNMIQNPMNEGMRALIYDTVGDLMPDLYGLNGEKFDASDAGSIAKIKQAIKNPENEGKIMQAVVKRMVNLYGGVGDDFGYLNWTGIFDDIPQDRLKEIVDQIANGEAGDRLSGEKKINGSQLTMATSKNEELWVDQASEFKTAWEKGTTAICNVIDYWGLWFSGHARVPVNKTKSGGNK